MADLTRFAWAVLESIVVKANRLNMPILTSKCAPEVVKELLEAGLVVKRAYGRPVRGKGQASALWPSEAGKKLLAERRHGVQD